MERFVLRLFQSEVALQCKFVMLGVQQLRDAERANAEADSRSEELLHEEVAEMRALGEGSTPTPGTPEWDQMWKDKADLRERQKARREEEGQAQREVTDRQWLALQTIVISAANLSKLLWGSRSEAKAERAPLRASLEVGDDSCLSSRNLRNDFEHFDERIERWFASSEKRDFFGRSIGERAKFLYDGDDPWFGHYDPTTGTLSFWDNAADIVAIHDEANRILAIAEREAAKHHVLDE
jgi:hypothetical protein